MAECQTSKNKRRLCLGADVRVTVSLHVFINVCFFLVYSSLWTKSEIIVFLTSVTDNKGTEQTQMQNNR